MGFLAIRGSFVPSFGHPDGDSVHFLPDAPAMLDQLDGRPPRLSSRGSVMLRFEGIDAVEKASTPPWPSDAVASMRRLVGSGDTARDARGHILSRTTDGNGRPIAWVFREQDDAPADGAKVHLDVDLLRRSVNWWQVRQGHAYPLFYNTLFADLRDAIAKTAESAKKSRRGLWQADATLSGVTFTGPDSLKQMPPIWPKLWRRLESYARDSHTDLTAFLAYIESTRERVDLLDTMHETGLDNVLTVDGNVLRMTVSPMRVRVRSEIG